MASLGNAVGGVVSAGDIEVIKEILHLYSAAVDAKAFSQFSHIFTQDVSAVYAFGPEELRFEDIRALIAEKTKPLKTWTRIQMQWTNPAPDGKSVEVVSNFTADHEYTDGSKEGSFSVSGRYVDTFVLDTSVEPIPLVNGARGAWLIAKRKVEMIEGT